MKSIKNVLLGYKGSIVVFDNNTASVRENNEPHLEIPQSKLSIYIEKLHIHSDNLGQIKLGVWDKED